MQAVQLDQRQQIDQLTENSKFYNALCNITFIYIDIRLINYVRFLQAILNIMNLKYEFLHIQVGNLKLNFRSKKSHGIHTI